MTCSGVELIDLTEAFKEALTDGDVGDVLVRVIERAARRSMRGFANDDSAPENFNWGNTATVQGGGSAIAPAPGIQATIVAVETGVDQPFTLYLQGAPGQGAGLQCTIQYMLGAALFTVGPFTMPAVRTSVSLVARSVWVMATLNASNTTKTQASAALARGHFDPFRESVPQYSSCPAGGTAAPGSVLVTTAAGKLREMSAVLKAGSADPQCYALAFDLGASPPGANAPAIARTGNIQGAGGSGSLSKELTKDVNFSNGLVVALSSDPTQYVAVTGAPVVAYDVSWGL